jgi:formylglycine-generating enzyme required for sulfatase activity
MFKKVLLAMLALSVMFCLASCGKKEAEVEDIAFEEPIVNSVVPGEMVFIPAGEFLMGSNNKSNEDKNAFPEHKVKLPAFWIDKYEVTNLEFMEFSIMKNYPGEGAAKGSDLRMFATVGKENVPVMYITWNDAVEYCKSQGKRLPTEQEWEYAARGPNGNTYPWGNEWVNGRTNTNEAGREAMDIGLFDDVSPLGVHDMLGNVQEWTGSWYKSYPGGVADSKYGETLRVVRGLSPTYRGKAGNLWLRFAQPPSSLFNFGCRCAKDATPEDIAANQ